MAWFRTEAKRVADELESLYVEYRRLAHQLETHAAAAPYPHVGDRLREILAAEDTNARTIRTRLESLGGSASENGVGPVRSGRNSWERLVANLEDYRALLRRLSQLHIRWHDDHPEEAALVGALRDAVLRHRDAIVDLIARSDPHAID